MELQQTCKACGRADYFDFTVPDDVWEAIVPVSLRNRVVCLGCFDQFARERGVPYAEFVRTLYFAGEQASFIFRVETSVNG